MTPRGMFTDAERLAILETKVEDIEAMLDRRFDALDQRFKEINMRVTSMTHALYTAAGSLVVAAVVFGLALSRGGFH